MFFLLVSLRYQKLNQMKKIIEFCHAVKVGAKVASSLWGDIGFAFLITLGFFVVFILPMVLFVHLLFWIAR